MKTWLSFLLLISFFAQTLLANESHYFERHVREALAINQARLELYSSLSNTQSEEVSLELIKMEKALLPFAKLIDIQSRSYIQNDIPVIKTEIVAMNLEPFSTRIENPPEEFQKLDENKLVSHLKKAMKVNYAELSTAADNAIVELSSSPQTHCLVRHFLESIRRAANYAPKHLSEARKQNYKSPKGLINQFISLHLIGIHWANKIDTMAFDIQRQGLPILCQDVPKILPW